MDDKDINKAQARRSFLKKLGGFTLGGVAVAACGSNLMACAGQDGTGNMVKMLTPDGKLVEVDEKNLKIAPGGASEAIDGRQGIPGRKFVMVIDLAKCRNAGECMKSCQSAHQLHSWQHHINVLAMQDTEKTKPYYMPKPCMHCDNPPCVSVCPVNATFKRSDGIVLVDNTRCIGCRFCMAACPYSARTFNWSDPVNKDEYKNKPYDIEKNVPQRKGTVTKCCFSADCLRNNELPYCVNACPNGVYWFGDANDDAVTNGRTKETVRLSSLLEDNGGYQLMDELGTKPSVFYLPPKGRLFKFEEKDNEKKI